MINYSCRHYTGSKPCTFNKLDGSECQTCAHVSAFQSRILIIKLDALGDVLRTGSIVPIIAARHQNAYIAWVTRPEAVELVGMMLGVDEIIARLRPLVADGDVVVILSNGGFGGIHERLLREL